jgi:hypothetical protein
MRRRLNRDGENTLAEWLKHYKPLEPTRRLIAEALEAYAEDENQLRFHAEIDPSNRASSSSQLKRRCGCGSCRLAGSSSLSFASSASKADDLTEGMIYEPVRDYLGWTLELRPPPAS